MAVAKNKAGWTPSRMAYLSVTDVGGTVPFSNIGIPLARADYQCCCQVDGPITNGTAQVVAGPELDQMGPVGNRGTVSNGYFNYPPVHVPNAAAGQTVYYRVDIAWTGGGAASLFGSLLLH
jgi:hypothetical protein